MDYLNLIQNLEDSLRSGVVRRVYDTICKLNFVNIPDRHRCKLANLAWRSGALLQGLKILTPVINSEQAQLRKDVTPEQLSEYCVLLQKLGSTREALEKMHLIDEKEFPDILLYKSFCHFAKWEYSQTFEYLSQYIEHPKVAEYARLVGKINLISAYISEGQFSDAEKLVNSLQVELKKKELYKLLGNSFELAAQIQIASSDFSQAKSYLEQAEKFLAKDSSFDQLFVKKWKIIIQALETKNPAPLEDFKQAALQQRHWESVREADLFLLMVKFDANKFNYLTYGTPHTGYQKRIISKLNYKAALSDRFLLNESSSLPPLDLFLGKLGQDQILNPGKKIHQLLYFLGSDFYKPQRLGSIFSQIFCDENFDIFSSPNKIYQLVNRTRLWIQDKELPLGLREEAGSYKFEVPSDYPLIVDLHKKIPRPNDLYWFQLQQILGKKEWKRSEIMQALDLPLTNVNRFLNWCLDSNKINKIGQGPSTKYIKSENQQSIKVAS